MLKYNYDEFIKKLSINFSDRIILNFDQKWWELNYKNGQTHLSITCSWCNSSFLPKAKELYQGHFPSHRCKTKPKEKKKLARLTLPIFKERVENLPTNYFYPIDQKWWDNNFIGINRTEILYICPKHGLIWQRMFTHLRGHVCKYCGRDKNIKNATKTKAIKFTDFEERAFNKHGLKYTWPHMTQDWWDINYNGSKTKIVVNCKKHGLFPTNINRFLQGSGCPTCNESRGEVQIRIFLEENNINFISQKKLGGTNQSFDFFIPSKNLAIEFDGRQHFESDPFFGGEEAFAHRQKLDKQKNNFALENNINIIRIPYWNFDRINEILKYSLQRRGNE